MQTFILKRLLLSVPTILGAITLVFFALQMAPGDPMALFLPPDMATSANEETINEIRARYGFDLPLHQQYFNYLKDTAQLDFGTSLRTRTEVKSELISRIGHTAELGFAALIMSLALGVTLGLVSAIKRGSWVDKLFMAMPASGYGGSVFTPEGAKYAVLPIVTLGLTGAGSFARYTRSSMLEVLSRDYVRTARAKGLKESLVVTRHALRNAWIPLIILVSVAFGNILSGAVIVETVFGWPGIGRYLVSGIAGRDFPVVQACVLVIAVSFVLVNLLSDVMVGVADPRIRLQ
jgi:ABC-type dipeptide/oligopeptide/nickel transport system permease component